MQPIWIVLIPAYQPSKLLLQLLEESQNKGFHLIIINDGSSPEKNPLFRQAAQYGTVLNHPRNLGKGRAIKTGLSYIQSHYPSECCTIVTMDADGQHKVSDAIRVCSIAQRYPDALILGSRSLNKKSPVRSLFGNTVTRFIYYISTGQKIKDTQTGLRAFSAQMIPKLLCISGERYEYEMNVLLTCSLDHIPIIEQGIETIYINGNAASHFDTVRDSYRIYREILKFSAASLISFFVDYGVYSLLTLFTSNYTSTLSIITSNIGARFVSAAVNYSLNRCFVFRSNTHVGKSAIQYAILAATILTANTIVLNLLVNWQGMNRYIAKLVTEFAFFFISWLIQRQIIFQKKENFSAHAGRGR